MNLKPGFGALAAAALFSVVLCNAHAEAAEEACFERLDSGVDTTGWHRGVTNHHGPGEGWTFEDGALVGRQSPGKRGGILMTDRSFSDVEVVFEVKIDWGCDSGLFFRTTGDDRAYQVNVDHLPEGGVGTIWGEMFDTELRQIPYWLTDQGNAALAAPGQTPIFDVGRWSTMWHPTEFNEVRARVEGNPPHMQVWVSGVKVMDFTDTVLRSEVNASGPLAIQVHFGDRWANNGSVRYRNIRVKDLTVPCTDPAGAGGTAGQAGAGTGGSTTVPNGGVASDGGTGASGMAQGGASAGNDGTSGAGSGSGGVATAAGTSSMLMPSVSASHDTGGCAVSAPVNRSAPSIASAVLLALGIWWRRRRPFKHHRLVSALLPLLASCSTPAETSPPPSNSNAGVAGVASAGFAGESSSQSGAGHAGGEVGGVGAVGGAAVVTGGAGAGGNGGAMAGRAGDGGSPNAGSGGGTTGPSVGTGAGSCPQNLALKMPTMPSSDALVDGDYTTSVNFHQGGSFYVDFGSTKDVGRVTIVPNVGHTWSNSYTYSVSDDAISWTQVAQLDAVVWLPIERSFSPSKGRYFKVSVNGAAWPEGAIENEVEVYPPSSSTENLAQGKPVTSNYTGDATLTTDGDIGTVLDLSGEGGFLASSPAWTTVDFGQETVVNRVRYYSSAHAPTSAYDVSVSKDNVNFATVVHVDGNNYDSFSNHCFDGQSARYVRVTVPNVRQRDNSGPGTQIREIQVFGPGVKP